MFFKAGLKIATGIQLQMKVMVHRGQKENHLLKHELTLNLSLKSAICGSRKYPYHLHRRDLLYDPPSPSDFLKLSPKVYPLPPPRNFKFFPHPLEILLILKGTDA